MPVDATHQHHQPGAVLLDRAISRALRRHQSIYEIKKLVRATSECSFVVVSSLLAHKSGQKLYVLARFMNSCIQSNKSLSAHDRRFEH
jgi:hypothetical protein